MAVKEWGTANHIDVICVSETHYNANSVENCAGGPWVDNEQVRCVNWKCFFSSGVEPKDVEQVEKLKKAGKQVPGELKQKVREFQGVCTVIHKRLWSRTVDVRPFGGRLMKISIISSAPTTIISAYAPHAEKTLEEQS